MKKTLTIITLMIITMTAGAQIERHYSHGRLMPITHTTTGRLTLLNSPIGPASGLYTNGGPFDFSPDLVKLRDYLHMMQEIGFDEEKFGRAVNELGTFIKNHENEHAQGYLCLGKMYRNAVPTSLRNIDLALQYYHNVLGLIPENDHISRAQIYYLMSDCIDPSAPESRISEMARYLGEAAEECHYYASGLGDIYFNGWGCYLDPYLSGVMYDIAQRFGDETSYLNASTLNFFITHPMGTAVDTVALFNYERFLYYFRIAEDYGRARQCAMIAAERGFAPVCYAMAMMYEGIMPNLTERQRRCEMFYWLRKGADMGSTPCIEGLARVVVQYGIDTLKGPIDYDMPGEQFSEKVKSECAKQSFMLRQRAAERGSVISLRRLAQAYLKGNDYGYPKQNNEKAYILLSALAFHGNLRAEQELNRLVLDYTPAKRDIAAIDKQIHDLVVRINRDIDETLDRMYNNPFFQQPTYANYWTDREFDQNKELTQHPMYWSHLVRSYRLAIQSYRDLQKELRGTPEHYRTIIDDYCNKRIHQLEERMKRF